MKCYYQGCPEAVTSREHVPPKAFFPKDQRLQLITVPSCQEHNTDKSGDDMYALAQICLNSSPRNRARDVFFQSVVPQLGFNQDAFRRLLVRDARELENGGVEYRVDSNRLDRFFDSLSCGIVTHLTKDSLPTNYSFSHIYHNLIDESLTPERREYISHMEKFCDGQLPDILRFGKAAVLNEDIYTVRSIGIHPFKSSITLVHHFFGHFKVTSLLTMGRVQLASR